jgi:L-asparaginase / beta-aspartyl-peptidase
MAAPAPPRAVTGQRVVVIHGGAWKIPQDATDASVDGVRRAALAAMAVLSLHDGAGSALDAVEAAVKVMEDDPVFDAGRGSCLTEAGTVEMDALIMRGDTLAIGAVAGLSRTRNPISCARAVMEHTDHCLLAGAGADAFAAKMGLPTAEMSELITPRMQADYEAFKQYGNVGKGVIGAFFSPPEGEDQEDKHDTVGAVVLDASGLLACATSTGGITAKMLGRVGDSPLAGSGGFADNEIGAASTTGHGESILKLNLAKRALDIAARIRQQQHQSVPGGLVEAQASSSVMQRAVDEALAAMKSRVGGHGGIVAIGPDGSVGVGFTTARMPWAVCIGDAASLSFGIDPTAPRRFAAAAAAES